MKKIHLFISLAMASFAAAKDDATVVRVDRLPVAVMETLEDVAKISEARHQVNEVDRLSNLAGLNNFGKDNWDRIKKEGIYSMMSDKDKKEIYRKSATLTIGTALSNVIKNNLDNNQSITGETINREVLKLATSSGISKLTKFPTFGTETYVTALKQLLPTLGLSPEELDIDKPGALLQTEDNTGVLDRIAAAIVSKKKSKSLDPNALQQTVKDTYFNTAMESMSENGDPRAKGFLQTFSDNWTKGLDVSGQPKTPYEIKEGTKVGKKVVFYYNADSSTGNQSSEQFWTGMKSLTRNLLSSSIGKDANQKGTVSSIPLFDAMTNKEITDYAPYAERDEKTGQPLNWELLGYTMDDEGWTILISNKQAVKKKGEPSIVEIRNQDVVLDYLINAGFGPEVVYRTADKMMKTFTQKTDRDVATDILKPGQSRSSSAVSLVEDYGEGLWTRPIERLEFPMQVDGKTYETGTFKYYSIAQGKYIYDTNPLVISQHYHMDRLNSLSPSMTAFSRETFGNKVDISQDILQKGTNTLSQEVISVINNDLLSVPDVPGKLQITSAYRSPSHKASMNNPDSKHLLGDAVDFSLKNSTGNIDEGWLNFFRERAEYLDSTGVNLSLEFQDASDPTYRRLYQDPIFRPYLTLNPDLIGGAHAHLEYDRVKAARLAAALSTSVTVPNE